MRCDYDKDRYLKAMQNAKMHTSSEEAPYGTTGKLQLSALALDSSIEITSWRFNKSVVCQQRWWVAIFEGLCHCVAAESRVSSPPLEVMAVTIGITGDLLTITNEASSIMNLVKINTHTK